MSIKKQAIQRLMNVEGGYVNNPNDSGGETYRGITKVTARAFGFHGDMWEMNDTEAFRIYCEKYWEPLRLDDVEKLSEIITRELLDTGANMGLNRAGTFLQRSLNVLNQGKNHFPDLVVDGLIGSKTILALKAYLSKRGKRGETVLCRMLNSLQGEFYISLAERRPKDEAFIYGWFLNRVTIEKGE